MKPPLPLALCSALAGALGLFACGIVQPIGEWPTPRIATDWGHRLYALEAFAYGPRERGVPLYVEGPAAPTGGMVVVPSRERHVRALDAHGALLWRAETQGPNVAQPVVLGEDVLVASMSGRVHRLQQRNGRAVWVSDAPAASILSEPLVLGERLFVTSIDNRITALSAETGARLWDQRRPHPGEFSVTGQAGVTALNGDTVVTGFSDGRLVAYAAADGATVWMADLSGDETEFVDVDTTPILAGDVLVAGNYATGLYGLDPVTGDVKWRVEGRAFLTPTLFEGTLYAPQATGRVLAIDAATGAVQWTLRVEHGAPSTPAVTRRYVLVPIDTSLLLLERGTGRTLTRFTDTHGFSATPELAPGTVYAQSNSGMLYALGLY